MFLIIDNYDSFIYNLAHYFEELDESVKVYRNDLISIDFIKSVLILHLILLQKVVTLMLFIIYQQNIEILS